MVNPMSRERAHALTRELLDMHGLTDWRVSFNRAKRAAGSCNYRTKTVTLSTFMLAQRDQAESANTISHEVAHALTRGHGHDRVWKMKHLALGGDGKRCFVAAVVDDSAPWIGVCAHGVQYQRYRAPKPGARYGCPCREGRSAVVFERNESR